VNPHNHEAADQGGLKACGQSATIKKFVMATLCAHERPRNRIIVNKTVRPWGLLWWGRMGSGAALSVGIESGPDFITRADLRI